MAPRHPYRGSWTRVRGWGRRRHFGPVPACRRRRRRYRSGLTLPDLGESRYPRGRIPPPYVRASKNRTFTLIPGLVVNTAVEIDKFRACLIHDACTPSELLREITVHIFPQFLQVVIRRPRGATGASQSSDGILDRNSRATGAARIERASPP